TADDVVRYQLWKIDSDATSPLLDPGTTEPVPLISPPTTPMRAIRLPPPRRSATSTAELLSMAIICGLILGSLVAGMALYRSAVACHIQAPRAGWAVFADGRDSGV